MSTPIIATKIYIPLPRPQFVSRPNLLQKLDQILHSKLTLISAPAGFGKTSLVADWIAQRDAGRVAWLSLDEADSDPVRFLTYFICAIQTVLPKVGDGVLSLLESGSATVSDALLTMLLNDIAANSEPMVLMLDDYHVIEAPAVDEALTFLLQHLPPQVHLVMTTREDPNLPLPRLRVRRQLTEVRAVDLRFTTAETAVFLNQIMGLTLTSSDIATLETRTEGWIAGLQLAALSLQGHHDSATFIRSFTGSHHYVLDYLVAEVLEQQPPNIQTFLLQTSVLERMCAELCNAVLTETAVSAPDTLTQLENANLFIVPLDNDRRWYRYHHLFADLLRQRLKNPAPLHQRASQWYEDNGFELDAFHHATAANDLDRAERLIEGNGMPMHYRGAVTPVLNWLATLDTAVLNNRPSLWVTYASALSVAGQNSAIEPKLQAAEAALQTRQPDEHTRNLIGHIATLRALLAGPKYDGETVLAQSKRALTYLHPDNLPVRTTANWTLAHGYHIQGDLQAAKKAYEETIAICQISGNTFIDILATTSLGIIQELENQYHIAFATYQRVMQLAGDPALPSACEAALGLARLSWEWNQLENAKAYAQQGIDLAQHIENIDTDTAGRLFLARVLLAQMDAPTAQTVLSTAEQAIHQQNYTNLMSDLAAVQVQFLLSQGALATAGQLASAHDLPLWQARVLLAQENADSALTVLESVQTADAELDVLILQAVAYWKRGEVETAVSHLSRALTIAEPNRLIRRFVNEGAPVKAMLQHLHSNNQLNLYIATLLAAFGDDVPLPTIVNQPLLDPLSEREREVLALVAEGLSNREISQRLYLALNTVKGHNRRIYSKLQVQRRTEAVARARELGLI